jgi:hypothetical protein
VGNYPRALVVAYPPVNKLLHVSPDHNDAIEASKKPARGGAQRRRSDTIRR